MRHVDLCSGIGGFALGFEMAKLSVPVLFCDVEPWCRRILKKHWPKVPVAEDVKVLANDPARFVPEIATSSQQDTLVNPSVKQVSAKAKKTHATSGRTLRKIIASKDPLGLFSKTFMVTSAWDSTRCSLTWSPKATHKDVCCSSVAVGAPHKRNRVWIVGHTEDNGCDRGTEATGREGTESQQDESQLEIWSELSRPSHVADTSSKDSAHVADTTSLEYKDCGPVGPEQESHSHARQEVPVCSGEDVADTLSERAQGGTAGDKMQKMLGNHPEVRNSGTGTLNPTWVEWLMGYPKGWTDLKD